jgi:hypothetical protein
VGLRFRVFTPSLACTARDRLGFPCPLRVHITALQASPEVTDCCFASLAQRDTPLQHPRSSKSLAPATCLRS